MTSVNSSVNFDQLGQGRWRQFTRPSEQCKSQKIFVNDEPAKALREIRIGDIVKVKKNTVVFHTASWIWRETMWVVLVLKISWKT